ncbi:uncharacterized protein LOC117805780 isoform X2 [Notolabrus celidotus]|uniref:uncharacterized protein LOC117805780 isoform X2 n=1 Tax=Notolabrus celidotus TaxID=1203425 RepID=UPI00148FD5D7|nr:uncharacterized protein LOC117805780 isoform X2 [Notolabrus celidotus]
MKKQVTFSESQTVHRLHQDKAIQRSFGMSEPKTDVTSIHIPKTMTSAPFLKHSALTPAQKEYLYSIAASYSAAHVRNLINQHYMNVLHRCIRAGNNPDREDLVGSPSVNLSGSDKQRSGALSQAKPKEKTNTGAKNPGESPVIPSRQSRRQDHAVAGGERGKSTGRL